MDDEISDYLAANKTRLIFRGISEILGNPQLALLILTDEKERRQISIVCDKEMANQIDLRLHPENDTSTLLPEVAWKLMIKAMSTILEIFIKDVDNGQYKVVLITSLFQITQPFIRASDAILLSIVARAPIYIETGLMMRQSVEYKKDAPGVALPVNTISDEMLQKALDKAINEEKYELASHLRDEINRRKASSKGNKE